eukprot:tig00020934_g16106.t1
MSFARNYSNVDIRHPELSVDPIVPFYSPDSDDFRRRPMSASHVSRTLSLASMRRPLSAASTRASTSSLPSHSYSSRPGSASASRSRPPPVLGLPNAIAPLLHSASDYLSTDISRRLEKALELEREEMRIRRRYTAVKVRRKEGGPAVPESPYFQPYKGHPGSLSQHAPSAQEVLESILRPKSNVYARLYRDAEAKNREHQKWLEARAIPSDQPKRGRPKTAPVARRKLISAEADPYAGLEEQEQKLETEAAAGSAAAPGWTPQRIKEVIAMLARALSGGDIEEAMRIYAEEVPPGISKQELDALKIQAMKLAREVPVGAPGAGSARGSAASRPPP